MERNTDRVVEEALSLPADARLRLVERLLTSLNLPVSEANDRLWAEEAEHRVSQIEDRDVRLIPGDRVFSEIQAKHGK